MSRTTRLFALFLLLIALAASRALLSSSAAPSSKRAATAQLLPAAAGAPFAGRLLVYGRHSLTPAQVAAVARAVPRAVTGVYGGELAVRSGRSDYPTVPVETMAVDPASYAQAAQRTSLVEELSSGVVLSQASARLRKLSLGQSLTLDSGRALKVTAVVEDHLIGGYEAATSLTVLGDLAAPGASYLLIDAGHSPAEVAAVAARIRRALPNLSLRIETTTRNGFLSSADTVLTQVQTKTEFGEFAVRTDSSAALRLDSSWTQHWITSTVLPQLGVITCNRAVVPALRAAMQEITDRGLGALVHTADFKREGGCWNPRLKRFGGGQISSHAWGTQSISTSTPTP